jgi:thiamine-phosphate pyrophosphorylase
VAAALAVLPRGSAAVQLRAKQLTGRALYDAAHKLVEVTRTHSAPLLINDRADIALTVGAAGVHLPEQGLWPAAARGWLGQRLLLGASTHSLAAAVAAWRGGVDYVTFGPVYATVSKVALGAPLGLAALAEVVRALPIPVFALGGVDAKRAPACVAVGARLACIGAVLGSVDAAAGARALAEAYA